MHPTPSTAPRKPSARRALLMGGAALAIALPAAAAGPEPGGTAPDFALADLDGVPRSLASDGGRAMTLLYFFQPGSVVSMRGMGVLDDLYGEKAATGVQVMAVGRASEELAGMEDRPAFPVLSDPGQVHQSYGIGEFLPTTFVLDGERRVSEVVQGGGSAVSRLLTEIASRELSRDPERARTVAEQAAEEDPSARVVVAQSYIAEGRLDRAEEEIGRIDESTPQSRANKRLAEARLALTRDDLERARSLADEAAQLDPANRGADAVRGVVAVKRGETEAGLTQLASAAEAAGDTPLVFRELAYMVRGDTLAAEGKNDEALEAYQQAAQANPVNAGAQTGRGAALERMGRTDEAHAAYSKASSVSPGEELALALLERLERRQAAAADLDRQRYVDETVAALVKRSKEAPAATAPEDTWTSRPLTVAILPIDTVGLPPRPGSVEVLTDRIADAIAEGGRATVVEREILDKLIGELNLGSSELADPDAALKLGRLLAARTIVTGTAIGGTDDLELSLRVIDTETTKSLGSVSADMSGTSQLAETSAEIAGAVGEKLTEAYPLRGMVIEVNGDTALVDLGAKLGARVGDVFEVISEGEPVEVKGKILGYKKTTVGKVEITEVEDGFSTAKVLDGAGAIAAEQKIQAAKP